MPKIKTIFSKEFEIERIFNTTRDMSWLRNNGYKPALPASLPETDFSDYEKVKSAVSAEYSEADFEKSRKYIDDHVHEVLPALSDFISSKLKMKPQDTYDIYLTKYGTAGSYLLPNKVAINIKMKYEKGLMRDIVHEILHLTIEDLVRKYNISHWVKERAVNLLLSKCLPTYAQEVRSPVDTAAIDRAFEAYFPDMEKVLANAK